MRQVVIISIAVFGGWVEAYLVSDLGPTLGIVYYPVVMANVVVAHALTTSRLALVSSAAATITLAVTISYWWIGRGYLSLERPAPASFLLLGAILVFVGFTAFIRHLKKVAAAHDEADRPNTDNGEE